MTNVSPSIEFFDCAEIAQGGPRACRIRINGNDRIRQKFDPSYKVIDKKIIIPMRKNSFFKSGYVFSSICVENLEVVVLSEIIPYIRILDVTDKVVRYNINTYSDDHNFFNLY